MAKDDWQEMPLDDWEEVGDAKKPGGTSKLESFLRGGAQGVPFIGSFADEAEGALRAVAQRIPYSEGRTQARDAFKLADESNPKTFGGAQMAGAFVGDIPRFIGKIPTPITAGIGAAYGALEGGIYGLGAGESDLTEGDFSGALKDAGQGAAIGAAVPTVLKGVGKVGSKVLNSGAAQKLKEGAGSAGQFVLKKAGRVIADVPEDATERYIARKAQVKAARPTEELIDSLDQKVGKFIDDVDQKKSFLEQSKIAAKEAIEERKGFLKIAREEADFAFKAEREALDRVRPPEEMGDAVLDVIKSTRKELGVKSQKAFDILETQGISFNPRKLQKKATDILEDLRIDGKLPPKGPHLDAYRAVYQYSEFLEQYGEEELPASALKRLIQSLDDASADAYDPFKSDRVSKTLASLRRNFDKSLKESSTEYKEAMEVLAPEAAFYDRLAEAFKNPDTTRAALRNMKNPDSAGGRRALIILKEIDEKTGSKLIDSVNDYMESQAVLRSPTGLERLKMTTPAYNKVMDQDSALLASQEAGGAAIKGAEEAFEKSKLAAGNVSKIRPSSSESSVNRLKNLLDDKNIKLRRQVEGLEGGEALLEEIRDRGAQEAFGKDGTRGSRLSVVGGSAGAAIGTAMGGLPGATIGGSLGAASGAIADRYAGKIMKGSIDVSEDILRASKSLGSATHKILKDAFDRGPIPFAATHYILQQQDPKYREKMRETGYDPSNTEDSN